MMKVLTLTLIAMMVLSTAAMAEIVEFQAANTSDAHYEEEQAPTYVEDAPVYASEAHADPVITYGAVAPVSPAAGVPAIAPEVAPAIQAEVAAPAADYTDLSALQSSLGLVEEESVVEIFDDAIPLSAGVSGLFVEIYADKTAPNYADDVTLKSFVSYQGASQLIYQWQIDRGFGWENILGANGADYTFNYNESVSGCSFRLFVDVAAA